MAVVRRSVIEVRSSEDIVRVRQDVRNSAIAQGFNLVDQTKLVTAASELARNVVQHGGGGTVEIILVNDAGRRGVRLIFADHGPGIPDVEQAMTDGFSTVGGLGLGLGGARRLSNEFRIDTAPGKGTRVTIGRWH